MRQGPATWGQGGGLASQRLDDSRHEGEAAGVAEVLAVALGLAFLHAFYRTVESQWPTSYHTLTSGAGYAISASPFRYLLFRLGPTFVTSLFMAVSLQRGGRAVVLPVLALAVLHVTTTTARAVVAAVRLGGARAVAMVGLYVSVSISILLSAMGAVALDDVLDDVVPPLSEITSTLWTALLAAIAGAYLVKVSQAQTVDTHSLLERSRASIDDAIWSRAAELAGESGTEPDLVHAFMVVENLQRPRWFRRLENAWGQFGGEGTYGMLQVRASRPLSDIESIENALAGVLRGARVPVVVETYGQHQYERKDSDYLRRLAVEFNPSEDYAALVEEAYGWVESKRTTGGTK